MRWMQRFVAPLVSLVATASAGYPAFPEAEGFGAEATGGRGGQVIYVEHLEDAYFPSDPNYAGSLREALAGTTGPRIVVFRQGGIIHLKAAIVITSGDVTIAGQTAPGGGIGIAREDDDENDYNNLLVVKADNVVIRHVRLRPGFFGKVRELNPDGSPCTCNCETKSTGLSIKNGAEDVIVDHVSMSWGNDSSAEVDGEPGAVNDVTIQWSIIAEGITLYPDPPCGDKTQGFTSHYEEHRFSFHHNLFAHNQIRNPMITSEGHWELINNVIYDAPVMATEFSDQQDDPIEIDYIGNFVKHPTGSSANGSELVLRKMVSETDPPGFTAYVSGNFGPNRTSSSEPEDDVVRCVVQGVGPCTSTFRAASLVASKHTASPAQARPVSIETAQGEDLWDDVLDEEVGATRPARDSVDECLADDVTNGTGSVIELPNEGCGSDPWELASGSDVVDGDEDGMPDAYEDTEGFDDEDPDDAELDSDGDCYTNLEEYLNDTDPNDADAGAEEETFLGIAGEDGHVIESAAGSNVGGTLAGAAATLKVGDDTNQRELRAIVSFDTSALPETATLCSARLTLSEAASEGTPNNLGPVYVVSPSPAAGGFSGSATLAIGDWEASGTAEDGERVLEETATEVWEAAVLPGGIDTAGKTQVRLQVADNDASVKDTYGFDSADQGGTAQDPLLTVIYQP